MKKVIIVAPTGLVTGGAELLHQLCNCLNDNYIEAYIGYTVDDSHGSICWSGNTKVINAYSDYNIKILDPAMDAITKEDIFVISETALELLPVASNNLTFIWWLSVDNYLKCIHQDIINYSPASFKNKANIFHLVQSWYAYKFLSEVVCVDENKLFWLSDYIKESFYENKCDISKKKDRIVYNPSKGFENLRPIMEDTPYLNWIPIKNMTPDQVAETLLGSKIYIDFGNHPGKDRIPREAAASGCCVITNRMGAAAYYEDIPIPNEYKFGNIVESKETIISLIQDIFSNFEKHYTNFDYYRQRIKQEKNEFIVDATHTFKQFL